MQSAARRQIIGSGVARLAHSSAGNGYIGGEVEPRNPQIRFPTSPLLHVSDEFKAFQFLLTEVLFRRHIF